jgi:hypothetical protein
MPRSMQPRPRSHPRSTKSLVCSCSATKRAGLNPERGAASNCIAFLTAIMQHAPGGDVYSVVGVNLHCVRLRHTVVGV